MISTYDSAYNYAYSVALSDWAVLPSDYAAWYVESFGECVDCEYYDCPHPDHSRAYAEYVKQVRN